MRKLINPFVYFSGGTTLCIGLVIMAAMVVVAGLTGQTFRGMLSLGFGDSPFWRLELHLAGGWMAFSLVLYAAARAFSPSRIRFVDIAGNQALAKLPIAVMLACTAVFAESIEREIQQLLEAGVAGMSDVLPVDLLIVGIVGLVVAVWFFAWSWSGFSIAANMRGRRAVGIYIVCYIFAEVVSGFICYI